ncbi:MAG TPA: DUF1566 domain-containing protein [Leptospiraceae bacterium]|nr:DUF1566 domain-containing protein [Leptospiraceae bacterium]HMW07150.1 DUF1566 domain-containing protein [Leptospiraceae bacterium]HMX35599.1 DUF1566 domain-containing protein [Leptospiraceae bacterium]HMY32766.1 DUF1566 domain-containing protein [Leptospiraceae bacterium]HMZ67631.1 DUF1566 domain-containing protein [Leptospiraceae bacterium]
MLSFHHKRNKSIAILLGALVLIFIWSNHLFSISETLNEKNKLFIASLSIDSDVPETVRVSVVVKLKSHILERFGDSYNIISQSDLELLLKQVETFQKQGKDTRDLITQINETRDADEMIHGKVFHDNGQIKLLLNNLKRDVKTKEFYTKSIVDISFFENDFDFYIKEAAIKILNPRYKIKNPDSQVATNKKESNSKIDNSNFTETQITSLGKVGWGNFEGLMKWEEAVDLCESKGMRLPTPEELRDMAQLKNHILREPCCVFWTSLSNKKDSDYAYYVDINDGYGNFYHKDIDVRVRCVKK